MQTLFPPLFFSPGILLFLSILSSSCVFLPWGFPLFWSLDLLGPLVLKARLAFAAGSSLSLCVFSDSSALGKLAQPPSPSLPLAVHSHPEALTP